MLAELRVQNLGVVEDVSVILSEGMTALTGETGAGKTLMVDAIALLLGAPAEASLVRPGAAEAVVEGRFVGDGETVLTRVIPAGGRSRCYLDGRMVSAAQLAAIGRELVDLHGQHAHQSLLSPAAQRDALDRAAGIDTSEVATLRRAVHDLESRRQALGGDGRQRARQLDLLSYQLREIDSAAIDDPGEDDALRDEQEILADVAGTVGAAVAACEGLVGDDGVVDLLGAVVGALGSRRPLEKLHARLVGLQAELSDAASEARAVAESLEADPSRLEAIAERRRVLGEMRRKYGPSLAEAIAFREDLRRQVTDLQSHDERAARVEAELEKVRAELAVAEATLEQARCRAAPQLGARVEEELRRLAMPRARFSIEVEGETVTWMLGANPGEPVLPLAKVASGGELARAMLAARLVMGAAADAAEGPEAMTLVFDEVDAGIGGEAAVAVGQALAALSPSHQVLVVTHLAQVAAAAADHLVVSKATVPTGDAGDRTVATIRRVSGEERVVELARMLSGSPHSGAARAHAEELLAGRPGVPPLSAGRRYDASADG